MALALRQLNPIHENRGHKVFLKYFLKFFCKWFLYYPSRDRPLNGYSVKRDLTLERESLKTIWEEFIFNKAYNRGQNIWQKVKKSNKIRRNQKALISAFAYFLTAIAKNMLL